MLFGFDLKRQTPNIIVFICMKDKTVVLFLDMTQISISNSFIIAALPII